VNSKLSKVVSGIGPKVKDLRVQYGYSLQALAERSDVSAAAIHKIEQSGMVPTITTLLKIAAALNRPVAYFVEEGDDDDVQTVFTPAGANKPIYTSHAGIDLAGISGPYGEFLVAAATATVIPGAHSGAKPMQHAGEELVYMLSGQLNFTVGKSEYVLRQGDSLHFRTHQPHLWRNTSDTDAVAIWMALRPQ
jgi:transcriptional regulator with XRE-family HTH domain